VLNSRITLGFIQGNFKKWLKVFQTKRRMKTNEFDKIIAGDSDFTYVTI